MPGSFIIHVGALLPEDWEEWFDGAEMRPVGDGSTLIIASVDDQAMLFGLLLRVRDLGIPLVGLYPGRDVAALQWCFGIER